MAEQKAPAKKAPAKKAAAGDTEVYMKVGLSGTRAGQAWPARGESCKLPAAEAADLVANGYATFDPPEKRDA